METIADRILSLVSKCSNGNMSEFARRINVTPAYISKFKKMPDTVPSDRIISDICREFGVNEIWLRTGEGDQFSPESKEEEILRFAAKALKSSDEFKRSIAYLLAQLDESDWIELAKIFQNLAEREKNERA